MSSSEERSVLTRSENRVPARTRFFNSSARPSVVSWSSPPCCVIGQRQSVLGEGQRPVGQVRAGSPPAVRSRPIVTASLAEPAHQRVFSSTRMMSPLIDHPDPVGHVLGLLDVMGGEDDGDALFAQVRAPFPTCRGAIRRRRPPSARRGTGFPARGPAPWRSARGASCRRTARGSPNPSCPTATGRAAPARHGRDWPACRTARAKSARCPRPFSNMLTDEFLRHQPDLLARRAVIAWRCRSRRPDLSAGRRAPGRRQCRSGWSCRRRWGRARRKSRRGL